MSLSHEQMMDLMAYADGELQGDELARVEALLKADEEARRVVDAMGTLGEVVREGVETRAESAVAADGIVDGVMAAIAREPADASAPRAARSAEVVPLIAARRGRGGFAAAVVAAVALAAGAVLMLRTQATPSPIASEQPIETAPALQPLAPPGASAAPELPAPSPTVVAQNDEHGVDLEEVHSTNNKVNVIFVPSDTTGAVASVVVWIDDRHGGH